MALRRLGAAPEGVVPAFQIEVPGNDSKDAAHNHGKVILEVSIDATGSSQGFL